MSTTGTPLPPLPAPSKTDVEKAIKAEVDTLKTTYNIPATGTANLSMMLGNISQGLTYITLTGLINSSRDMLQIPQISRDVVMALSSVVKKVAFFRFTLDPTALSAIISIIDAQTANTSTDSGAVQQTMMKNRIGDYMASSRAEQIISQERPAASQAKTALASLPATIARPATLVQAATTSPENAARRATEEAAKKAAEEAKKAAEEAAKKAAEEAKKQASAARASAAAVAASELTTATETFKSKINSYNSIAAPPRMAPLGKNFTEGKALAPKLLRDLKDAQKGGRRSRSLSKRAKRSTRSKRSKSSKSSRRSKSSKSSRRSRR